MISTEKVAILGSGSWGTALGTLLAHTFQQVTMIGLETDVAEDINTRHRNERYLPGLSLQNNIQASTELTSTLDASLILFVIPTSGMRKAVEALAAHPVPQDTVLMSCSKGIEHDTGTRMSEIIREHFPNNPLAVLSGPNHAEEVSLALTSCAVIGSKDEQLSADLQSIFSTPFFRSYTSDDMAGMELGGAIKNVFALAAGIASGLKLGDNAIAALVTRGLAEMTRLGTALGGQAETFMGLSGIGDLMVTCYSSHSRNNRVGKALGEGQQLDDIIANLGMVAEGVPNTKSIYRAARNAGVRTPLIDAVYSILYENRSASSVLKELLSLDMRKETD
ncbi:NAD(P)-dependent glycerol-3-phosphate dehydrogenase [Verrucomicrobiaceae bacterium N1E253]|uniref:Glycerol-3-phosphate dehydrogenase [NAD(P)+] n=1 Tax=Oceaniferula marina TaxID=2748318 RepID=A0A851GHM4_9BACT|nr:NAD(P)H-dependent glycerol-3-phosphate dehydrogenase [Oceaniferula marina]NWK54735.1 NAD(P)-dependent glycerol-3-phosphate dehydrogenase [Oceaniferula marina]